MDRNKKKAAISLITLEFVRYQPLLYDAWKSSTKLIMRNTYKHHS